MLSLCSRTLKRSALPKPTAAVAVVATCCSRRCHHTQSTALTNATTAAVSAESRRCWGGVRPLRHPSSSRVFQSSSASPATEAEHRPQARLHCACMKLGLFAHSPLASQRLQSEWLSSHRSGCSGCWSLGVGGPSSMVGVGGSSAVTEAARDRRILNSVPRMFAGHAALVFNDGPLFNDGRDPGKRSRGTFPHFAPFQPSPRRDRR